MCVCLCECDLQVRGELKLSVLVSCRFLRLSLWNSAVSHFSTFKWAPSAMIIREPEMLWPQFYRPSLFTLYGTKKRIDPDGQTCCYCCWSDCICRLCRPPRLLQVPFPSLLSNTLKRTGSHSFHDHFHGVLFLVLLLKRLLFTRLQSSNKNSPVGLYLCCLNPKFHPPSQWRTALCFGWTKALMLEANLLIDKKNNNKKPPIVKMIYSHSNKLTSGIWLPP